ncbi:MAG TPA: Gfo/Idh/MocA family oxidoreductase [Bacteroidales bacterium]|nr:Gfo/Idh/MocA family oxidoreductase [Bacteroidales bacterium]
MRKKYNWGILAPGKIAHKFTEGLKCLDNANLYSIGSRSEERAGDFAKQYGYIRSYGSYEEFAADPELEVVYIATPHSHHMEHTLLCLENGKAVICEKAFALNSKEVEKMISFAKDRKLFLMEALWPPFQPSYNEAHSIIDSGGIGKVIHIRSQFAFKAPYEPDKRLYNLELGGGALLDIGIYPVMDTLAFMGVPDEIFARAEFSKTGVDETINVLFGYRDGSTASLYSSLTSNSGTATEIYCENGRISLNRGKDRSQHLLIEIDGTDPESKVYSPGSMGYHFEAEEVMKCLDQGKLESDIVPLKFSSDLMTVLDKIRGKAGIKYPGRD